MNNEDSDFISQLIGFWNGDEEEPSAAIIEGEHGKLVKIIQAAYGDWYIYEDGYEEFDSIGD